MRMKGKHGLGSNGSLTIVAVNPVKGGTTTTVTSTRGRLKYDVTRCSLHFLGPLSRSLLRRMKRGFTQILAVRSKMHGNNVKDTMLRFLYSRNCGPYIAQLKLPSTFIRRKPIGSLCTVYNLSRGKVFDSVARVVGL